jgi:hypothetical protein
MKIKTACKNGMTGLLSMRLSQAEKQACVILGMHRSGTSALASMIASLGAALPERLNPPGPDNPEGYFEPAVIVELHELMLQAFGSVWFDLRPLSVSVVADSVPADLIRQITEAIEEDYGPAPLLLMKDPRMCRFFGLSRQIFELSGRQCSVVLALRHPAEVAASLAARNQMSASYAGILWARHMIEAEQASRGLARVTVSYEELVTDWAAIARRIRTLPGSWLEQDPTQVSIKPALRHHKNLDSPDIFGAQLGPMLDTLYAALMNLTVTDGASARDQVDTAANAVLSHAARLHHVLELEFLHLRLHAARTIWQSDDPARDKGIIASLLESIGRSMTAASQG